MGVNKEFLGAYWKINERLMWANWETNGRPIQAKWWSIKGNTVQHFEEDEEEDFS